MTLEELLEQIFPEGPDNSIEWLMHCLDPFQSAIIYVFLEKNASILADNEEEKTAYYERMQRILKWLKEEDEDDWEKYISSARETAELLIRKVK